MNDKSRCTSDLLGLTAVGTATHALGVSGFVELWRGRRPAISELCADETVVEQLQRAGRLELARDRTLLGIHGLTLRDTPHRIEHSNGLTHTWCALDAIGIPAALGVDAAAVTECPVCHTNLSVEFAQGVPAFDPDYRLWMPSEECRNLVEDFCQHANLYCGPEHMSAAGRPTGGRALEVDEVAKIGRSMWSDAAAALLPFRPDQQDGSSLRSPSRTKPPA